MQSERGQPSLQELRQQLGEAEDRVWELEARLHETQHSTSYQLGRGLVLAAKSPRDFLRLPAQLWRLYQRRGMPKHEPAYASRRSGLFSSYRSFSRERQGLQIGAVASRRTVRSLGAAFDVVPLWPHDANEIANATSPDVVVIESAASMPGEAWSALGTAIGSGLEETLVDLIGMFDRRSIPVLFWWTTPIEGTSDLSRVSGRCGFVVADDSVPGVPEATPMPLGVDLAELEPARPSARRDASAPLLHLSAYEADPRVAPAHRLVETAIAARARVLREPGHLHTPDQTLWPRDVRSCYRAAAWTTPTTDRLSNRCISMLGAGVPVFVCREPKEFGKVVIELPRDASVDEAAASARQRMESPGAVAEVLRTIHRSGTVQQRFFEGLRSLGIEASPPNDGGVGVLIMAGSDIERAVDSITGQSVRPTEVLVDDADMRHLLSVMLGPDIPVKPPALGGSPRHVHWRGKPWPKTHLHDLLIASEVVGTDWFSGDDAPEVTGSASMEMSTPWWIEAQDG